MNGASSSTIPRIGMKARDQELRRSNRARIRGFMEFISFYLAGQVPIYSMYSALI
jgi:hypothetical protein